MMKLLGAAGVATMLAYAALGFQSPQIRPKVGNLPKILTKPNSTPTAIEKRPDANIVAGRAPVVDLGLPDGASEARAINESGMALVNNLDLKRCFVWTPEEGFKPVPAEGANFRLGDETVVGVVGRGLNNKGQVAGFVITDDKRNLAFLWDPQNGMRLLGTLGGNQSVAIGVSDNGVVAGASLTPRSKDSKCQVADEAVWFKDGCAFAWTEELGMIPIGRFGTKTSMATSVTPSGLVAGSYGSHVVGNELTQGFLWRREEGVELINWRNLYGEGERVSNGACIPYDVRNDGTTATFYYHYSSDGDKPYPGRLNTGLLVRNGHAVYELKTPNQDLTYKMFPLGLNDSDITVGYQSYRKSPLNGAQTAFAWRPGAEIADLETFTTGWQMTIAYRINSKNQIVGVGVNQGKKKGFIMNLSPTLLPTAASRALTRPNPNVRASDPKLKIPPLVAKPPG